MIMSLPFVVEPQKPEVKQIGTAKTGILEFPVLGGITVGEVTRISAAMKTNHSLLEQTAKLSEYIAKEQNISLLEAKSIIESNGENDKQLPIYEQYRTEILKINEIAIADNMRQKQAIIQAFIQCRLNLPNWNDFDSLQQELADMIWEFALDEMNANPQPETPLTEDDIKKQQAANGSRKQLIMSKSNGN